MWVYIRSSIQFHLSLCLLCVIIILFYYYNSVVQFEIRDSDISCHSFFIQDCFGCPECVCVFPHEAKRCPLVISEELCWDFDEDCIEICRLLLIEWPFYYINPTDP